MIPVDMIAQLLRQVFFLWGHVSNQQSFPQPLTQQEERELLARHFKGDPAARQTLIERNLRLVAHIAKKYHGKDVDQDDLISIGSIGLIKAVNTYSPDRGTALATYAAKCIENEILMTLRASKKRRGETSLQDPIGTDREGNEISLMDILGVQGDPTGDEAQLRGQVEQLYRMLEATLSDREYLVLLWRYGLRGSEPMTQRDVACKLGISRSYVSRIEKKALEKLEKAMRQHA
ncbi:MAG: RNA polymerase sporulation sigma factor SigK [Christensenellales bacterium]|jgi:RNA polymerase sporulation-specific sigma factor